MAGRVFTKAEAKVSDAALAALYKAKYAAERAQAIAVEHIWMRCDGHKVYTSRSKWYYAAGRNDSARLTFDQAVERVTAKADPAGDYRAAGAHEALTDLAAADAALLAAEQAVADHREWENHGMWARYFLVEGGHIHSSTGCHTLYPTTRIGWLPELSGESEAEAVAAHGALLCTVCFPSAPVEWTDGRRADDDLYCAGKRPVPGSYNPRLYSPYGECAECGEIVSITTTGSARKHKKPKAAGPALLCLVSM